MGSCFSAIASESVVQMALAVAPVSWWCYARALCPLPPSRLYLPRHPVTTMLTFPGIRPSLTLLSSLSSSIDLLFSTISVLPIDFTVFTLIWLFFIKFWSDVVFTLFCFHSLVSCKNKKEVNTGYGKAHFKESQCQLEKGTNSQKRKLVNCLKFN